MEKNLREKIGFLLIFSSILLFVSSFVIAESGDLSSGQKTFLAKCAQCHGKDGKGVAKMVKVLKVDATLIDLTRPDAAKLTDADAVKTITNGKKKMPKYKGKLTDSQIKDALAYVRTLQGDGKK